MRCDHEGGFGRSQDRQKLVAVVCVCARVCVLSPVCGYVHTLLLPGAVGLCCGLTSEYRVCLSLCLLCFTLLSSQGGCVTTLSYEFLSVQTRSTAYLYHSETDQLDSLMSLWMRATLHVFIWPVSTTIHTSVIYLESSGGCMQTEGRDAVCW